MKNNMNKELSTKELFQQILLKKGLERYIKHCESCDEKIKLNVNIEVETCHDCQGLTIKEKLTKFHNCYFCPPCSQFRECRYLNKQTNHE